jgi:hypothetical protein
MTTRIAIPVRDPATGAGVAAQTVTVKKVTDDSTVDDVATNADGIAIFSVGDIGNPGPIYTEFNDGSNDKIKTGEVIGQVGGFLWVDAINDAFKALGEGRVVAGAANELACTENGANMLISVETGAAILKDGYVYVRETAGNVTITAADATNPRIDRIVLRLKRESETDRGTVTLVVLAGTPAGSPAAPALTQSSTTWETSLAQVLVDAGVTAIAVGKVTLEREFTLTPPASMASGDIFYVNAVGKLTRLAKSTNGYLLSLSSGLPAWVAPSSSGISGITVQEGDVTLDADVTTLDLDAGDFVLTESPENEANIRLATHEINRKFFDDTLNDNSSSVSYETQVSGSIVIPSTGTWSIEAVGMARIATSDGGNVQVRVTVDGDSVTSTRSGPAVGGQPISVLSGKSGLTAGSKTITLSYRAVAGNTAYMSNGILLVTAYRTA